MDSSLHPGVRPTLATTPDSIANRRSGRIAVLGLYLWDIALIFVGFALAYAMRYNVEWPAPLRIVFSEVATANFVDFYAFLPITLLLMAVLSVLFVAKGLYRAPRTGRLLDQIGIIISGTITGIAVLIVFVFLYKPFYYSRLIFALAGVNIIVLMSIWRLLVAGGQQWLWAQGIGRQRLLVVGGTGLGQQVMNSIAAQPGLGYSLVGYLDDTPILDASRAHRIYRHVGALDDFDTSLREYHVQHVILALPFWEHDRLPVLVQHCVERNISYQIAPDLYQLSFDRVDVMQVSGLPLITPKSIRLSGFNLALKRVFDVSLVLLSAPLTLPLVLLLALLIRRDSPGPILFQQRRVGKNGAHFTCYKFRTMVPDAEARLAELAALNEADGPLFKMKNDPRVTRVGRFLRRSSLDELPQLMNVLRGEMSLIGPRPALPAEVEQYEAWHHRRLEVSPGLAGLSQALGRSDMSFDETVRLDIYYAENWSIGMDLRIMLMLVPAVLSGKGAY
jgi:exopolysaccharide biosynthesis polyprenyl glycosylphosphotransferase